MAIKSALIILCSACALWGQVDRPADIILMNGKIITVDAADSIAEAVAVRDGKILEVGAKEAVMRHSGPATKLIDLHGKTATPGLIDSHLHFASVEPVYGLNLSSVKSIEEVLKMVRAKVANAKPGEWIQGQGWDEGKLAEKRYILASDLDKVAPANPVWLVHTTGHYAAANSLALRAGGITPGTKNPPAGTIDIDAKGHPTGILKESAAMTLVTAHIPEYSLGQMRDGYQTMMAGFNQEGITAIKDPGMARKNWDVYSELRDQNKLTIHLFALWSGGTTMAQAEEAIHNIQETRKAASDDRLISGGVKLYMDGSGGARTAWVTHDWNKQLTAIDTGNKGYPLTDPAIYRQQVQAIHKAGIHVGTHAIGDQAIDWVVDTYTQVLKETPTQGLRHSIIHANIPSDRAIAAMADLQKRYDAGYPEAQAEFIYWIGDTYAANFGPARSARLMPFQTYLKAGVQWAGGSDYSVTPFAPRLGIWASIARETLKGTYGKQPFGTAESVDIHAALRSYTIWSAHQLFLEKQIGSIEAGKDADIAVWDRDLYTVPTSQIKDMKCQMTLFQGRIVYDNSSTAR